MYKVSPYDLQFSHNTSTILEVHMKH